LSPESLLHAKRQATARKALLRNNDGNLLLRGSTASVRANNDNSVLAGFQRFREMAERAIGRNVGN
jgi:hypothetical protein